jgi:hypothetical protein
MSATWRARRAAIDPLRREAGETRMPVCPGRGGVWTDDPHPAQKPAIRLLAMKRRDCRSALGGSAQVIHRGASKMMRSHDQGLDPGKEAACLVTIHEQEAGVSIGHECLGFGLRE